MKNGLKIFLTVLFILAFVFIGFAIANRINERDMEGYIDSFPAVEYESRLTPEYDENGAYFTTDRDFRVLHLTDIHICGGVLSRKEDKMAINAVAAMISTEKPDLVIITGDIAFAVPWGGTINNAFAHRMVTRLMERLGVYWTASLGNHDSESYNFHSRRAVGEMYSDDNLKYSLFDPGPEGIYGIGNHIITLRNTEGLITQSFVMMDSNSYTHEDPLGILWIYDNIHEDQIEWYRESIAALNAHNAAILAEQAIESDASVSSMLFLHIPPIEVREAYLEYLAAGKNDSENVKYIGGEVGEKDPYVYSSNDEDELFETILELQSTKVIFYGHDHLNNIILEYRGVTLAYGYSVDYFAYSDIDKQGSQRGCTLIISRPDSNFEIIHENYYQDKYDPLYEKENVDLTK